MGLVSGNALSSELTLTVARGSDLGANIYHGEPEAP